MKNRSTFDKAAEEWDKPQRIDLAGVIRRAILERVSFNEDMVILDFGAGTGLLSLELSEKVKKLYALDNSEKMLDVLKKKRELLNLKNVETVHDSLTNETFPQEKFHAVISSMALHHVKDIQGMLKNFHVTLRSGGVCAVADLDEEDGGFHSDNTGVEHFGFNQDKLKKFFEESGFNNVSSEIIHSIKRVDENGAEKSYGIVLFIAKK